jgi:membrane-bound lytic murein transglycosylase MltF
LSISRLAASVLLAVSVPLATARAQQPDSAASPPPRTIGRLTSDRLKQKQQQRYDPYFRKYSKRFFGIGFDWRMFKAQGMAESNLNPNAKSYVGARGVMQLMPSTYHAIQTARPEFQAINDPEWNIAAGIMHDRYLWTLWQKGIDEDDRARFMFASYNAGEGTIGRARRAATAAQLDSARWLSVEQVAPKVQRWRYRETLGYVRTIQTNYDTLRTRP